VNQEILIPYLHREALAILIPYLHREVQVILIPCPHREAQVILILYLRLEAQVLLPVQVIHKLEQTLVPQTLTLTETLTIQTVIPIVAQIQITLQMGAVTQVALPVVAVVLADLKAHLQPRPTTVPPAAVLTCRFNFSNRQLAPVVKQVLLDL
jgi:hypothetical protein